MAKTGVLSQYLTTLQASEYLGISVHTLRYWKKSKKFMIRSFIHPMNGRMTFLKEDLDKFKDNFKENHHVDI